MIQQLYTLPALHFADVYGGGTYNSSTYSATGTTTTTTTTTGTNSGSSLVNTGVYVIGFVTIASLIILTAIVVRVARRKKQPKTE